MLAVFLCNTFFDTGNFYYIDITINNAQFYIFNYLFKNCEFLLNSKHLINSQRNTHIILIFLKPKTFLND